MFGWLYEKEPSPTQVEINRLYAERAWYDPTGEEYQKLNARLKELLELKKLEEEPKRGRVSPDTKWKVGGMMLLGGVTIFKENLIGPITSKALSLVTKFI